MGFADDWKKAKTKFEGSTKAKKPSDTFLGVFRKGSGIEAALKDADKAKTAGDLKKAIQAFKAASATYVSTLDKSINDPKAVASDAKQTYAEASKVLKGALEGIVASAERTAESLANADKKTTVDPAKVRAQADALKAAKAHVALRQRVFLEIKQITDDYAKRGTEIEKSVEAAKQSLIKAKAAKGKGETMQAGVAAGVVGKFAEQAQEQLQKMQSHWDHFARQGGDLMKARSDMDYSLLAPEHQHYRKESNDLFGAGDKLQQALQGRMKQWSNQVLEARAASEEAENYQVVGGDPKVYAQRATEIRQAADGLVNELGVRMQKADGWVRLIPTLKTKDQKGREQTIGVVKTVLLKHGENIKEIALLESRLDKFPESALEDRAVIQAANAARDLIKQFRRDAEVVTTKGKLLVKELSGG